MRTQKRALGLGGNIIPRAQRRLIDQRCEERHVGLVDRAIVTLRDQDHLVAVLNLSARGAMIESDVAPRIGEAVAIRFPECNPIHAFVRWVRDGRVGLNFGHEIILGL